MVQEISGEHEFRRLTGSKGKLVVVSRCSAIVFFRFRLHRLALSKSNILLFLSLVILNLGPIRDGVYLPLYCCVARAAFGTRLAANSCVCASMRPERTGRWLALGESSGLWTREHGDFRPCLYYVIVFRRSMFPERESRLPVPNHPRCFRKDLVARAERESLPKIQRTRYIRLQDPYCIAVVEKTGAEKRSHPRANSTILSGVKAVCTGDKETDTYFLLLYRSSVRLSCLHKRFRTSDRSTI